MIVLDTHAWIWWAAEPGKLSVRARRAIHAAEALGVSPISCWEVAMLVARGRLDLDRDVLAWVRQALALPRVAVLPLTPEIAVKAAGLEPGFPGDPADRMIVATALDQRAALLTKDRRLRSSRGIRTIW